MKPGDLVRLHTFTHDLHLMNSGLTGGTAILVASHHAEGGVWWDMLITRHPTYGGTSEFVEAVAEENIKGVIDEAR